MPPIWPTSRALLEFHVAAWPRPRASTMLTMFPGFRSTRQHNTRSASSTRDISTPDITEQLIPARITSKNHLSTVSTLPGRTPSLALSSSELYKEAQIARLSALCYMEWEELKHAASQEGFKVVAGGDTFFTRWYLARGYLNATSLPPKPPSTDEERDGGETSILLLRGVKWRSADTNSTRVWQHLIQTWTTDQFADNQVARENGSPRILAHVGMAKFADTMYQEVLPHLGGKNGGNLILAGHSMGGSISKLLMLKLLNKGDRRADQMECHTYGSFPVMSSSCGGNGRRVLELAGISPARIRNWVLDYDYVPRMMISSDPYYQLALSNQTVRGVLDWGKQTFGQLFPVSETKFVFRNVGQVYLLSKAASSQTIEPLDEENLETLLKLPADIATNPVTLFQTVLDHNFSSYTHDILVAAQRVQRFEERNAL